LGEILGPAKNARAEPTPSGDPTRYERRPLVAGQQAQVSHDAARLPTCRGQLGYVNGPSGSINAFYSDTKPAAT
jgi:hypothetical protein